MNEQRPILRTDELASRGRFELGAPKRRLSRPTSGAAFVALLVVAAIALVGCSGSSGGAVTAGTSDNTPAANTVTVTGQATVFAAPDQAVLVVSVQNDAADAATAMDQNAKTMQAVIDRLKGEGLPDSAIETTGVQVYPLEAPIIDPMPSTTDPTTPRVTGYRAQNTVQVTITKLDTVGSVYAAAIEAGANNVSGPTWRLSDDSAAINDALAKAVGSAKGRADALAAAAGASVGAVLALSDNASVVPPVFYGAADSLAKAESVSAAPIQEQQLEVTAQVTAVYELKR